MPFIIQKQTNHLKENDLLLANISDLSKIGNNIDDMIIERLKLHNVHSIPVMSPEFNKGDEDIKMAALEKLDTITELRFELYEKLQNIFIPFNEDDVFFTAKGKRKRIMKDSLLRGEIDDMIRGDIQAGSEYLLSNAKMNILKMYLTKIYEHFNSFRRRDVLTKGKRNVLPRQNFKSIRLNVTYNEKYKKITNNGDMIIWHAIDTTCYFLLTMININKIRNHEQKPLSSQKYNTDENFDILEEFRYKDDLIIDAAMGVLLHPMGFYHTSVLPFMDLHSTDQKKRKTYEQISQLNANVMGHLLNDRNDISSFTKIIINNQLHYADLEPDQKKSKTPLKKPFIHEFTRLFFIVNAYDELSNEFFREKTYNRFDIIQYLKDNSKDYEWDKEKKFSNKRFDKKLLGEFLKMLAIYDKNELLILADKNDKHASLYLTKVHGYFTENLPLFSVIKDNTTGHLFEKQQLLIDLNTHELIWLKDDVIMRREKNEKLDNLHIIDYSADPLYIEDEEHPN